MRRCISAQGASEDRSLKWSSLEHSGVLFPPEYVPHGVKMLYDGRPVDLTPEQEEVCAKIKISGSGQIMPGGLPELWIE